MEVYRSGIFGGSSARLLTGPPISVAGYGSGIEKMRFFPVCISKGTGRPNPNHTYHLGMVTR